ncbi:uncharacterized protein N7482_005671 [Penicillium canariense]|uniref:Uncharacterized protein n=1 Tax=Penicillium canariense TaxID=189055 RepID=A0A9W9I2U9_9EURO|nr:uncharacterized protein N7482_005671 [Penicillium canariense]KAJ5166890.1 hypothetical protein N7482_005671 [Penicillium canariense]
MRATASNATEDRHERRALSSDDDPTSSSGSSSSESESEGEDSEDSDEAMHDENDAPVPAPAPSVSNIAGRPKPNIQRMERGSDILSRLSTFLPKMKDANEDLEREIAAGRGQDMVLDAVEDDGKDYIEMNLGLGVLEEKRDSDVSFSGDEGDDESPNGDLKKSEAKGDSDLLGQLMGGNRPSTDKPSIEEMAE